VTWIFLDESGQFVKSIDGRYFLIASFTVGDPRRTEKKFKMWQRQKFPRPLRNQAEIKFTDINISDRLRLRTVEFIASLDVRIRFVYHKRENIPEYYIKKGGIKAGELYTNVVATLLEQYLPISDKEFRAFCDQRQLKGIKKGDFEVALKARILPNLSKNSVVQIEMIDSTTNANIQIADWITGALAYYVEGKKNGEEYYKLLKNNIISEGVELFSNKYCKIKKLNRSD